MNEWRFPSNIDNTMLKDWRRCPQYFMRKHCQGLHVPEPEVSIDLHFGASFATAIEAGRRIFFENNASMAVALEYSLAKAVEAFGGRVPPPRNSKSLEKLLAAVSHYFWVWPFDEDTLRPVNDGIEYQFSQDLPIQHPVTGKNLKYCGRMDMLARDTDTDGIVVVDEKTAGRFTDAWMSQWDMDTQLSGYIWIAAAFCALGELPHGQIRGIGVNSTGVDHVLVPVFRTQYQIDLWYDQTMHDIAVMTTAFQLAMFDYRPGSSCTSYGRACEYTRLCTSPNPDAFTEQYEVRFWNPISRTEGVIA